MLIFSIPVAMVIEPQIHELELFVSIEDVRIRPEPVKKRMAPKKPQPEPVKERGQPIEPSNPTMQQPEIIEPVKEAMKDPERRQLIAPLSPTMQQPEVIEPVKEAVKDPVEIGEKPIKLETMSQPSTETKEPLFIPPVSNITERSSHEPAEGGLIDTASDVEKQPLVSHRTAGGDRGTPIETRFGAPVAPAFLHRVMPVYPMMARRLGQEGKVVLKLTIDENGILRDIEVIEKAGYGFTEAAVEAVKKSTFLPAKQDGKPIASKALLPIRFRLEKN